MFQKKASEAKKRILTSRKDNYNISGSYWRLLGKAKAKRNMVFGLKKMATPLGHESMF